MEKTLHKAKQSKAQKKKEKRLAIEKKNSLTFVSLKCSTSKYPNKVKLEQYPDYSARHPVAMWRSPRVAKSA